MGGGQIEGEDEAARRRARRKGAPGAAPNRAITLEHRGGGRRSVYVPVKRRAARFLEALAESGNVTLSCDVAGLRVDRAYTLRREDEAFARGWAEAKARFEAAQDAGEETLDEERLRRDGLVLRTGRDGRVQVAKAHKNAWGPRHDRIFLAALAETGNIRAAARAAGFSYKAAWERARRSPDFAARLDAAKAEAVERLEWGLIEQGEKALGAGLDGEACGGGWGGGGEAGAGAAAPADPDLAKWLVKRADEEKARASRGGGGGRGGRLPRVASDEEVLRELTRRVKIMGRRVAARERERLGEGWTRTPEGWMIPPGYGWVGEGPPPPLPPREGRRRIGRVDFAGLFLLRDGRTRGALAPRCALGFARSPRT